MRHMEALNAQTGPVLVAYPSAAALDELATKVASGPPEIDATLDDGARHSLWVIHEPQRIAQVTALFDALPALYIADGHHRSAAARPRVAERRAAASIARSRTTHSASSTTTASCATSPA